MEQMNKIGCQLIQYFSIVNYNFYKLNLIKVKKFKGFVEHVISTASEWSLTFCLILYILTFVRDFKRIEISHPDVIDQIVIQKQKSDSETGFV